MRFPINDETEIIVKFASRKQHERFCHETGAGSRFIYREADSGRVQVLCRLDRRITRHGEQISSLMFLNDRGRPLRSVKLTSLERSLLEAR
jgi:hypothetical protein